MNCLLLGGTRSVGKSGAIFRLAHHLLSKGFVDTLGLVPVTFADFRAVLEGVDGSGKQVRIVINSATDTVPIIKEFKQFQDDNGRFDLLISSVRDGGSWPRGEFFSIMGLSNAGHTMIEVPLAKVTRRGAPFIAALNWYEVKLDALLDNVLKSSPFNL